MKNNKKTFFSVLIVTVVLILAGTLFLFVRSNQVMAPSILSLDPQSAQALKYTLYIGLNDKDTYKQLIPYEDAEQKVRDISFKYVDGFTVLSGKGAYKDDEGIVTYENSLVLEFTGATEEQMEKIMDEVLEELNQNSVLMEKQMVQYEFYEGQGIKR